MRLNDIKDNAGSRKTRLRVGRGIGSGIGKTSGRGGKGQTARTGVRIGGFEGGQMPLHRRLPKRGFRSSDRRVFNEINTGALQAAVEAGRITAGQAVDNAALYAAGLVRRLNDGLRILGDGEIKSALKVTADHVSAKAKAAIEQAGGSVTIVVPKVLAADEAKRKKSAAKKSKSSKKKGGESAD